MKIIADGALALLDETFGRHGEVTRLPGRELDSAQLRDADVLLVRSVTRVGSELLAGTPVRFVGTATIGTDHLDTEWLDAQGVRWASAPGCNADAAAQYTLGMIVLACQRLGRDLADQSVGILGRGNVGSRLQALLTALGVRTVACDPPLAEAGVAGLEDRDTALQQDIVSLHVPLTRTGPHATLHMLDAPRLARLHDGALLVNTARGDVVGGTALRAELQSGRVHAALDVWPGEPDLDPALLEAVLVASPHVAGYSVEGKQNGTLAIYREFLGWQGLAVDTPARPQEQQMLDAPAPAAGLADILDAVCGVRSDDRAMRNAMVSASNAAAAFDHLRREYRLRHDFAGWTLRGLEPGRKALFRALGFDSP